MQSSALLAYAVKLLHASHEKIERKEARSKLHIAALEGLCVAEITELVKNTRNDQLIDQPTGQVGQSGPQE